jgi:ribosomal protein L14
MLHTMMTEVIHKGKSNMSYTMLDTMVTEVIHKAKPNMSYTMVHTMVIHKAKSMW